LRQGVALILLIILVSACRKRLAPENYVNWFKNSKENLSEVKTTNYNYELRYLSPEVGALMEFGGDRDSFNRYISEYKQWSNFNLKIFASEKDKDILKYKLTQENEYFERLQYFISYINNDIVAIGESNDTIPCAFHHYERTYKMTPFSSVSLSFPGDIKKIDKILVKLPFDNKVAAIKINKVTYPELKL
jgi:hypothetical protein